MTETNYSQTIPISPNVFPTKNKKMTEQPHYKLNVDKIKTIEDVKNVFELLDLGFYFPEDHKNYKFFLFKELTIQPEEPRKSLEEIKQELDKEFEELLVKIKRKSHLSKQIAERNYEKKFDKIFDNFEYAVKNGHFPQYLSFTTSGNASIGNCIVPNSYLTVGSGGAEWTSNFVFKPNAIGVGYWEIDPNIQVYRKTKPNRIVRYFSRLLLDIHWKDG
tara:strand:+ start:1318 stop:1971 length:654 start_codon:yes stop_codon:yes gene_type:complete